MDFRFDDWVKAGTGNGNLVVFNGLWRMPRSAAINEELDLILKELPKLRVLHVHATIDRREDDGEFNYNKGVIHVSKLST